MHKGSILADMLRSMIDMRIDTSGCVVVMLAALDTQLCIAAVYASALSNTGMMLI